MKAQEIFGKNIRSFRVKKQLSQEVLAERAGLHRTYIGMVERGEKNVTLESMSKLAKALGVKVVALLGGL